MGAFLIFVFTFSLTACEPWQQSELVGLGRTDDGRLVALFLVCDTRPGVLVGVEIGEGEDPDSPVRARLSAKDPPVGFYFEIGLDPVDDRFTLTGAAPGSLRMPMYIKPSYRGGTGWHGSFDRLPAPGESLWLDSATRQVQGHPFDESAARTICV